MLFAALVWCDYRWLFLQPVRKVRLEPVPAFRTDTQVATGFPIDPPGQVDPLWNLVGALAVPRQILAQMSVGLRTIIAKAAQHINAYLLRLPVLGMALEELQHFRDHVHPAPLDLDEPGLMVDPGRHDINLATMQLFFWPDQPFTPGPLFDAMCNLPVRSLHPMTQPNRLYLSILVACPGVHRHRVGIIEKERSRPGNFANIFAKVEQSGDCPLRIHDSTRADCISHALINSILQRDVDIGLKCF